MKRGPALKFSMFITFGLLSLSALAAQTKAQVNDKAQYILIKNMNSLVTQTGMPLASEIAEDLKRAKKGDKSYKIMNSCTYDKDDSLFECKLSIRQPSKGLDSLVEVNYELEREHDGLPSEDLLSLAVEVNKTK
jgi:hypothetical protein